MNNKEIPLRNKQYYLVPIQESGEYIMDIVFAGEVYPPQRFILDANNNSAFGYKLAKTVEDRFYLVDLVNKGHIVETNSDINIGISTIENTINFANTLVINDSSETTKLVSSKKKKKKSEEIAVREEEQLKPETASVAVVKEKKKRRKDQDSTQAVALKEEPKKEKVYGVVEEIKSKPKKEKKQAVAVEKTNKPEPVETKKLYVSNCVASASDPEVNRVVNRLKNKSNDEDRMIVLKKKVFTGCITCAQLHRIVEEFNAQFDRLNAIKFLRSGVSDIQNLTQLEDLFKIESGKSKLTSLMYQ